MRIGDRFRKLWADPVWSMVIATAIVAILGSLWTVFNRIAPESSPKAAAILGKPRIVEFRLDPSAVFPGERATLLWHVSDADSVVIQPDLGSVKPSDSCPVIVSGQCTYTLVAKNSRGTESRSLVIVPTEPPTPTVQIIATPNPQLRGEKVTLTWTAEEASSVLITGIGEVPPHGSYDAIAAESQSYEIKASNRFGRTASDRVTVVVEDWPTPILSLRVDPNPVIRGSETTLIWESKYAKEVMIEPFGDVALRGSAPLRIDESLTVTGRARGPGGTQEQTVFIEAVAPPPPTLAIYPPERDSQVQNASVARQLCDDILHRVLSGHFRLVEPPSVGWPSRTPASQIIPPDYVTSLHVTSRVSRGGLVTKESVEVTVRLSLVRRVDNFLAWSGTAVAKKSTLDLSKFASLLDRRFAGTGFQSDVQRLEYQALSEALEKVLQTIGTFRPS